jgi:hypothetical protein
LPVKLAIRHFSSAPTSTYHYVNLLVHSNGSNFGVSPGRLQALRLNSSAGAQSFDTYKSAVGSELLTTVPGDNTDRVLYSLPVGTISSGAVLVTDSEFEMENDGLGVALLTARVILADTAGAVSGTVLGAETTQGVSSDMFRNKRFKGAIQKFGSTLTGTKYVNVIVRSNSLLTVRANRGTLQVMKISP